LLSHKPNSNNRQKFGRIDYLHVLKQRTSDKNGKNIKQKCMIKKIQPAVNMLKKSLITVYTIKQNA